MQALAPLTTNQKAFLSMASVSEGTARAPDPYRVCYKPKPPKPPHVIVSLDDHPSVSGEWEGESLADLGANYEHSVSTAAGRYQIIKPTWLDFKKFFGMPEKGIGLFAGPYQDACAMWLIKQHGALTAVNCGQVETAVQLCANIWASFAGSTAPDQHHNSLQMLSAAFESNGGRAFA